MNLILNQVILVNIERRTKNRLPKDKTQQLKIKHICHSLTFLFDKY